MIFDADAEEMTPKNAVDYRKLTMVSREITSATVYRPPVLDK